MECVLRMRNTLADDHSTSEVPWRNADLVSACDATHWSNASALHTLLDC